jgi:hypothetical protein
MRKRISVFAGVILMTYTSFGQFEPKQLNSEDFENIKVTLGGDFALQYQVLKHHADAELIPLGTGFNLPTANLNTSALLAPGMSVVLETYLSSRHHNETWVKGGYITIDELSFIKSDGIDRIMDYLTLRVGDMEINYGDAHYRRSDNGKVINNPFVGNYIMDAFSTQVGFEVLYRNKDWFLMGAVSNGSLKPALTGYSSGDSTYVTYDTHKELAFYWKAGIDKQFNDNFRLRFSLSGYHCPDNHSGSLYNSERAGSRYYFVMNKVSYSPNDVDVTKNHTSGNYGPGTTKKDNSIMANLFTRYRGFEVFGTYERFKGTSPAEVESEFNQYAVEGLYRFGKDQQFYTGLRYNAVKSDVGEDQSVNRIQVAAGWFLIKQIILKLEYVKQNYIDFATYGSGNAGFDGIMVEAAISF